MFIEVEMTNRCHIDTGPIVGQSLVHKNIYNRSHDQR